MLVTEELQALYDKEDEAYAKGHNAYHDGYRLSDNPYNRGSDLWAEWRSGWKDAEKDAPYWKNKK